jgi:hypothetical protein
MMVPQGVLSNWPAQEKAGRQGKGAKPGKASSSFIPDFKQSVAKIYGCCRKCSFLLCEMLENLISNQCHTRKIHYYKQDDVIFLAHAPE